MNGTKFVRVFLLGLFTLLVACARQTSVRSVGQGVGAGSAYSYNNIPVTYDTISGTIKTGDPGGTFTQAAGTPEVTQQQAVATAAGRLGGTPQRIVTGYLDWEGGTTWKGGTVWVVSYQGGDTCPPLRGPGRYAGLCAGTVDNAIIDATTGDWIATFGNGSPVKQGSSTAEQSLNQIFQANDSSPIISIDNGKVINCTDSACEPPFSVAAFLPTSQWIDQEGNDQVLVYGGSDGTDEARGGLRVASIDMQSGLPLDGDGTYYQPGDVGPVTISAVNGSIVSFSYSGGKGTFDLSTDTFGDGSKTPTPS